MSEILKAMRSLIEINWSIEIFVAVLSIKLGLLCESRGIRQEHRKNPRSPSIYFIILLTKT